MGVDDRTSLCLVEMVLGFVECVLLFPWPRVFAPPHLRDEPGWAAQIVRDRRAR